MNGERNVFLICIGSELLKGEILNSNVSYLGRTLLENGFHLAGERSVPDDPPKIHAALDEAMKESDWVITTGGLGPTFDDITRKVLSEYFRAPLEFSRSHYQRLIRHVSRGPKPGRTVLAAYERQCCFPKGARVIPNALGSAYGFLIRRGAKRVIALPGVPREFEVMIHEEVIPKFLLEHGKVPGKSRLTACAIGISEVDFLRKLGPLPAQQSFTYGIYPDAGEVRFTALAPDTSTQSKAVVKQLKMLLLSRLKHHLYSLDSGETFEEVLGNLLRRKKKTVSIAESCTGGYGAKLLTHVSGSSDYFVGGITAYANSVKEKLVEVPKTILQKHGAVSKPVAAAMASHVWKILNTSYGIGITGIAGPRGGTKTKPVGLVYVAVADSKKVFTQKLFFKGDRERIRHLAGKGALYLLWKQIKSGHF